jgi:Polyketide cyclase / dehydrase and lipid transport
VSRGRTPAEAEPRDEPGARLHPREVLWLVGRFFPPGLAIDAVTTSVRFEAPPEAVWQRVMFYEEVPQRPPLLLRTFLPSPVRTQGAGKRVGATVECTYSRGRLLKRITVLDRPRLVCFEVTEQRLGVERCVTTVAGSYEFRADGLGCELALTTKYRGHLRPRWLWRPFERLLAHQLHRHILGGMGATGVPRVETERHAAS